MDVSTNNGATWINLLRWEGESQRKYGPGTNVTVNISIAAGCSNALIRFHYYSPGDYYWEIDNVIILADAIDPTEFKAEAATKNQINLSWKTNEIADEVILAYYLSENIGTPLDGIVYNVGSSIPGGGSVIYKGNETDFQHTNFISEATKYFYKIWSVNSATQYSLGVPAVGFSCVGSFPYLESYEADLGVWWNIQNNNFDWKRRSANTPSANTGPNGGANGSSYYIFTEATTPGNPWKTFLTDASFDFTLAPNPELSFFYHMYGSDIGSLHVDVYDQFGSWHSNIWEISGEQQTSSEAPWKSTVVEMQQFGGQSPLKIRFRGITGDGNYSDIAVDYISISNRPGNLIFTPPTQSGIGHLGSTVQYDVNLLNLTGGNSDFNLFYTNLGEKAGWNEFGPANSGAINYRDSTNITFYVTIDPNAAASETHTSIVTSVSTDGIFTNSSTIITKCKWNYDFYFEDFNTEIGRVNGWPNGWTNFCLGQSSEGWYHGVEKSLMYWWATHDYAYAATNWFVSPYINLNTNANQIYISFYFAHETTIPMVHNQNIYISKGSRNPADGDFVKLSDIDYIPGSGNWCHNFFDISKLYGCSNFCFAIDYTSGNPLICFDDVSVYGNKTGVDDASIVSPKSLSIVSYQSIPVVTGKIHIAGRTGISGPASQITAQFGYGIRNSIPFTNPDWTWEDAAYSYSDNTHDFFISSPDSLSIAGDFDYAFRFKNGDSSWVYADTDGSSNGYIISKAGKMTINMIPKIGELVKNQSLPESILYANASIDNLIYDYTVADDFLFTVDTKVNSFLWNAIYWGDGRTGSETGILFKIYANNSSGGDHPGAELYSEIIPGYSCEKFVKNDDDFGINIYKYQINPVVPFDANKNTKYWFSVQMEIPKSNGFWGQLSTPDPISGQNAAQQDLTTWELLNFDIGFELYGTITNYGQLTGKVSRTFDGLPLQNSTINITDGSDNWKTYSGSNGEYNIILPLGSYSVSAEINNYQTQTFPGISINTHGQIVTQNFSMETSLLYYSPAGISNSLNFGSVVTNKLSITNDGPVALSYNLTVTPGTYPDFNLNIFENKSADPFDCYAVNLNVAPANFVKFNSGNPQTFITDTVLPIDASELICAGDFLLGDFNFLYAITFYGRELVKISTADASISSIGVLQPAVNGNEVWSGMTAAPNGDVYGVTFDGEKSYLYKINIAECKATLIGEIPMQSVVIDIAINSLNDLYGIEIENDNLIKINTETAEATIIGNIGINADYAQGLDFNDMDDTLYYAAYSTNFGGQFRTVNTNTGASTSLGSFPSGHDLDAFAIPKYNFGSWATLSEKSGTISPDSNIQVDVIFNAGAVSNFGIYNSEIVFSGNNINPVPNLPLTMVLLPSPIISATITQNFGSVDLFVTSSVPLLVGNTGAGILTGNIQNIASPFFISGDTNYFIPASSNILLSTFFVPEVEGDFLQNIKLTGGGGKTVVFKGNAIPEPITFLIFNFIFLIYFSWRNSN